MATIRRETGSTHGVGKECMHNLGQKNMEGRCNSETLRYCEEKNIETGTNKEQVYGFILLRTETRWWALVNTVMNVLVP